MTPQEAASVLFGEPWEDLSWTERTAATRAADALAREKARADGLRAFGEKVNAIRNSIIGFQRVNWSEHIYPLVAVLDEAGFKGAEYEEACRQTRTLAEECRALLAERERLRERVEDLEQEVAVRDQFTTDMKRLKYEVEQERDRLAARVETLTAALQGLAERGAHHDTNPTRCHHKGETLGDVEDYYLAWVRSMDETVKKIARAALVGGIDDAKGG